MIAVTASRPVVAVVAPRVRIGCKTLAMVSVAAAAFLWGTAFVATKPILMQTSPVLLAFTRFLIAAIALTLCTWRGGRPVLGRQEAVLGLSGITLYFLCQHAGLQRATATDAILLTGGGQVVLTALLGMRLLSERLSIWQGIGALSTVAGMTAVALSAGGHGFGSSEHAGQALLLLATGCAAVYFVVGRRAFAGTDSLAVLTGSTILGTLFLLPPTAAEILSGGGAFPSGHDIGLLLYLGIGCSAVAYVLSAYGLRHLTAAQNAILGALELPVGIAAAACLLREVVGLGQAVGAILVLIGAGLVAATVNRSNEPAR
jgi:drug/metabolite transporter (DMT)-like permease